MKNFLSRLFYFVTILFMVFLVGIFIPATPRSRKSLLFSKTKKDILLKNEKAPRIIFIGGSNLSFGLNCQIVKDSLGVNPINTGIHARIGLVYMLDNAINFIRSGDIVVVIPEYEHFYGDFAYGGGMLLHTVFDVDRESIKRLNINQWANIYRLLPKYAITKFELKEYFNIKEKNDDIYGVDAFNRYGDAVVHWSLKRKKFSPYSEQTDEFNTKIVDVLKKFDAKVKSRGGVMYITYPGLQDKTFENMSINISTVEHQLKNAGLLILGTPDQYKMEDSLMFDMPYHLTKKGVDIRTTLLMEDLKSVINVNKYQNQ